MTRQDDKPVDRRVNTAATTSEVGRYSISLPDPRAGITEPVQD